MKISYLGPKGTFTEKAALKAFPEDELIPFNLIRKVVMAVEEGKTDFGVVPIENFYNGEVRETLDSLNECTKTKIVREISLPIIHCLGALPNHSKIKKVFSKDQALEQCSRFLLENYPEAEAVSTSSTARAVNKIIEENITEGAAIASEKSLKDAGLKILAKDLCQNNKTRFVILGKEIPKPSGEDITFLVLHPAIRDAPGVLFNSLKFFSDLGINLNSIQSRPDGKKGYYFYIELNGHEKEEKTMKALENLRKYLNPDGSYLDAVKILGSCKNTHWKDEN